VSDIHPTAKAIAEAVDRIARTPDGAALYVLLQRRMMTVSASVEGGALQSDHGERTFASKLIGLMAQGIFESGGRTGHTGSSSGPDGTEQPVVVPRAGPVSTGRSSRAGGRAITTDTIVPGWNDTRDT
jgi:hypothetical protein